MRQHKLFAKMCKCSFAQTKVEYLGHIISKEGLQTNPSKLEAVTAWSKPGTTKALRGFLGLAGYYKRFIKSYGEISKPLTDLLKKDAFVWTEKADVAFEQFKFALYQSPVLALPNFQKEFTIEANASYKGIGAVLFGDVKRNVEEYLLELGDVECLVVISVVDHRNIVGQRQLASN
nr:putative nucleotidyltransferase, Ribonuclease H [Ipomoea batatas]